MTRVKWAPVLDYARIVIESYTVRITLRQLLYRLVAKGMIPDKQS
jgi:hypothetical protein